MKEPKQKAEELKKAFKCRKRALHFVEEEIRICRADFGYLTWFERNWQEVKKHLE